MVLKASRYIECRREIPEKRKGVSKRATAMPLLVTSASGTNGNGFGALLAFVNWTAGSAEPLLEDDRIADPRGF